MTEIFNITNRALICITKDELYKTQTVLSIVEILLLIVITIIFVIIGSKLAKIMHDLFHDLMFDEHED